MPCILLLTWGIVTASFYNEYRWPIDGQVSVLLFSGKSGTNPPTHRGKTSGWPGLDPKQEPQKCASETAASFDCSAQIVSITYTILTFPRRVKSNKLNTWYTVWHYRNILLYVKEPIRLSVPASVCRSVQTMLRSSCIRRDLYFWTKRRGVMKVVNIDRLRRSIDTDVLHNAAPLAVWSINPALLTTATDQD